MKEITFLKESLIAHRGLHNLMYPENSVEAFKRALVKNYSIELDIHLTKDKEIVVFHDNNLKRMIGIDKKIKDCTYEELKKYTLGNTHYKIPLLKEVLALINGKVPLIVELKNDHKVGVLEKEVVKLLDSYSGCFAVKSFRVRSVLWFKLRRKDYVRGQLLKDNMWLFTHYFTKPDFISYNIKNLPNKKITNLKKRKILLGWTVKDKKEYERLKDYCDNFICEDFIK